MLPGVVRQCFRHAPFVPEYLLGMVLGRQLSSVLFAGAMFYADDLSHLT